MYMYQVLGLYFVKEIDVSLYHQIVDIDLGLKTLFLAYLKLFTSEIKNNILITNI